MRKIGQSSTLNEGDASLDQNLSQQNITLIFFTLYFNIKLDLEKRKFSILQGKVRLRDSRNASIVNAKSLVQNQHKIRSTSINFKPQTLQKTQNQQNIKIYQNDENTKSNSNFNSVFNNLDENLDSISNVMAQPSQIGQVSSQSRNNDLAQNFKSISLPKIAGFSNPHDSYNSQLEKIVSNNKTRFNGNSLLKKQVALDKQSNRYSSVNSSMAVQSIPYFLDSPDFQSRKNAYQALGNGGGLVSDISRTNQSQIYSQSKTNKDQQVSVWDALRMHDLKKYQIEQYQSKMKKLERQKQLKEYLEQQVHNKHFTVNGIQNSQKLHDREMINQTIDVLKQKEERQKQQRKDQLLKSVEFNLQNKTTKDFMIQQQLQNSLTPNNADGGIHVLFKLDQQKVQEGKQKKLETQNLLKNLISTKEITKKSENKSGQTFTFKTLFEFLYYLLKTLKPFKMRMKRFQNKLLQKGLMNG